MDDVGNLRARAWIGDAVLGLYARKWILAQVDIKAENRAHEFIAMTANEFLACIGEPTKIEAAIGDLYESEGLDAAFKHIEETILPLYQKQRKNRR
ncbi:MAG: hypothetical protein AAFX93_00910 [Verrucomicrobiota bacterium]